MKQTFFKHSLIKHRLFKRSVKQCAWALLFLAGSATQSLAQEVIEIEGTSIRGNQELPQILYLVPWQEPDIRALTEAKSNLALQAPLAPIERYDYLRQLNYHQMLLESQKLEQNPQKSLQMEHQVTP